MDPDPDPGGPKTCGSGSGSSTLLCALLIYCTGTCPNDRENRISIQHISSLQTSCRNPVGLEAVIGQFPTIINQAKLVLLSCILQVLSRTNSRMVLRKGEGEGNSFPHLCKAINMCNKCQHFFHAHLHLNNDFCVFIDYIIQKTSIIFSKTGM
jgi:hypothetical protein